MFKNKNQFIAYAAVHLMAADNHSMSKLAPEEDAVQDAINLYSELKKQGINIYASTKKVEFSEDYQATIDSLKDTKS